LKRHQEFPVTLGPVGVARDAEKFRHRFQDSLGQRFLSFRFISLSQNVERYGTFARAILQSSFAVECDLDRSDAFYLSSLFRQQGDQKIEPKFAQYLEL
jgi:hypothetical protein